MSEQPLPNDAAARSPTGEILEPSQIKPAEPSPTTTPTETSTPTEPKDNSVETSTGAPETYADFKAPENYTLDPKMIAEAAPIFKELNLSQDQAQRLVDLQAKLSLAAAKAPQETYEALRNTWRTEAAAHPDLKGRLGPGGEVSTTIGKAIDTLGPDLAKDFRAAMDLTGAGDNPAFIRAFYKLATAVSEGTHVTGKGPSPEGQRAPGTNAKPTPAQALYPNLPSAAAG